MRLNNLQHSQQILLFFPLAVQVLLRHNLFLALFLLQPQLQVSFITKKHHQIVHGEVPVPYTVADHLLMEAV
ncbi:hypothetical protein BWK47_10195 [Synechocystis sp. CACIAM 05]|nr:hypothetical protein BWK47_10195 [Synechocystis sp. CACIAM 05]